LLLGFTVLTDSFLVALGTAVFFSSLGIDSTSSSSSDTQSSIIEEPRELQDQSVQGNVLQ
ncbi:hypothetical protein Tco_0498509, partial [Tanacetum coccineum]